jgi:hypothetical protein
VIAAAKKRRQYINFGELVGGEKRYLKLTWLAWETHEK